MSKVCIIGASGKLGRYMVQHSLDRDYEIVGVCRTVMQPGSSSKIVKNSVLVKLVIVDN